MRKHLLTLAITLALPAFAHADAIQAGNGIAVVQTQSGTVQGYIHRDILTYKGIPYATAARFMPPQKVANWQGEKLALTYGDVCPQVPMGGRSFFFAGPEMPEPEHLGAEEKRRRQTGGHGVDSRRRFPIRRIQRLAQL